MSDEKERKIGQGHAAAMGRLGLKELRNAVNPSRESAADSEIGLYGTLTQGEIAQARQSPGDGPDQESSTPDKGKKYTLEEFRAIAKELAKAAEREMGHGKDQGNEPNRGIER